MSGEIADMDVKSENDSKVFAEAFDSKMLESYHNPVGQVTKLKATIKHLLIIFYLVD